MSKILSTWFMNDPFAPKNDRTPQLNTNTIMKRTGKLQSWCNDR